MRRPAYDIDASVCFPELPLLSFLEPSGRGGRARHAKAFLQFFRTNLYFMLISFSLRAAATRVYRARDGWSSLCLL